jgi:hypothetical protein
VKEEEESVGTKYLLWCMRRKNDQSLQLGWVHRYGGMLGSQLWICWLWVLRNLLLSWWRWSLNSSFVPSWEEPGEAKADLSQSWHCQQISRWPPCGICPWGCQAHPDSWVGRGCLESLALLSPCQERWMGMKISLSIVRVTDDKGINTGHPVNF